MAAGKIEIEGIFEKYKGTKIKKVYGRYSLYKEQKRFSGNTGHF